MYTFRSMLELTYKIRSATNYDQFCYYLLVARNPKFLRLFGFTPESNAEYFV